MYCTRRLCESGRQDAVMLGLIVRGFVLSLDILPLSKFDRKRQVNLVSWMRIMLLTLVYCVCSSTASRMSQRIEIGAPASNSNFTRALQGIKNVHASFAAQCPPRCLDPWVSPASQLGILRTDFITPYLSPDESLPRAMLDPITHDPDGILQMILAKSENKFYTEDNRVEYLRMKAEKDTYSYVLEYMWYLYPPVPSADYTHQNQTDSTP